MADRTIKPDDTHDLVLQNNDGSSKIELNEDQTVKVSTGSSTGDDFTVNTTQLVVEGDTGYVGIGTAAPDELLHLKSSATLEPVLKIENSNENNLNAQIHLVKSTTDEEDDDFLGQIDFKGMNSASELLTYGRLQGISSDVSDGEEDGRVYISAMNEGTLEQTFNLVSGKVGVGTTSPSCPLSIKKTVSSTVSMANNHLSIGSDQSGTNSVWNIGFGYQNTGSMSHSPAIIGYTQTAGSNYTKGDLKFYTRSVETDTAPTVRMTIDSSGSIGAPSGTNIYNASDVRLKQNVTNLSDSLEKIKQMQGVSFKWIDGFCPSERDKTHYGLIAQDLMHVDLNLVSEFGQPIEAKDAVIDKDGTIIEEAIEASPHILVVEDQEIKTPLRVEDKYIIPILVEAVKELSAKVTALENA